MKSSVTAFTSGVTALINDGWYWLMRRVDNGSPPEYIWMVNQGLWAKLVVVYSFGWSIGYHQPWYWNVSTNNGRGLPWSCLLLFLVLYQQYLRVAFDVYGPNEGSHTDRIWVPRFMGISWHFLPESNAWCAVHDGYPHDVLCPKSSS